MSSKPVPALTMRRARQLEVMHRAVTMALGSAAEHLSRFAGQKIVIEAPRLGLCPIEDLVDSALGSAFDMVDWSAAETIMTGIYLGVSGDLQGHFLLMLTPADAQALVAPLVHDLTTDQSLYEQMTLSALGEVGNITASALLNALADAANLRIAASCPLVITNMAGAILEMPMIDLAQCADEALFIETRLLIDSLEASGSIALIPRPEGLAMLIESLAEANATRKGRA